MTEGDGDRFVIGYDLDHEPIYAGEYKRLTDVLRSPRRIIGRTEVGAYFVSTVFLGVDHSMGRGEPPILYESMAWRGTLKTPRRWETFQWRYATRDEASAAHAFLVEYLTHGLDVEALPDLEGEWRRTYNVGTMGATTTDREGHPDA